MIYKSGNRRILVKNELNAQEAEKIIQKVEKQDFQLIEVLKDHSRSRVSRIKLNNLDLVLKVPIEKNKKLWIRFLTWFRRSEVFKNLQGMSLLNSLGFKTTQGYLACEYRNWGMVTNSWILYYYLDAEECLNQKHTFSNVVRTLEKLHKQDILHGDPQIRNFLTSNEGIYLIDANPKRSSSALAKAHEFAYLKRSQPEIKPFFGDIQCYTLAVGLDTLDRKMARFRRKIKQVLRLKR
ncbi:MAG: lipopolysaccharide core heptose(II) kinase RfaY [Bacteroidota bacterium]